MIRVVLAVVLSSALLGASLPVADRAERHRNAALATAELAALDDRARRLAAGNDPVEEGEHPAAATIRLAVPSPVVTDGGRIVVDDDRLVWAPVGGPNRTVDPSVPLSVEGPISITGATHVRLVLVDGGGEVSARDDSGAGDGAVVRIDRPRVQEG